VFARTYPPGILLPSTERSWARVMCCGTTPTTVSWRWATPTVRTCLPSHAYLSSSTALHAHPPTHTLTGPSPTLACADVSVDVPAGCVTLWSPNMSTSLVKMLCHGGPVRALAFDAEGRYMATTGMDSRLKVRGRSFGTRVWAATSPRRLLCAGVGRADVSHGSRLLHDVPRC
jgi:hypothetical protein